MNNVWINSQKTLNEIHQDVKETVTCQEFQESLVKKNQQKLLEKIQTLQEHSCLNFIQQTLYGADVKISKPFYDTEFDFKIHDNLEEFNLNGQSLNKFFYYVTKNIQKFAETVNFLKIPAMNSLALFVPFDITPFQWILYSTLPSIFGYCWCSELAESYIDFIFHAVLNNPTFLDTYMTYSFANFIRVSDGETFFKSSMSSVLLDVVKNQSGKITEQELFTIAENILLNMINNISLLPRHARRIIRRFFGQKESEIMAPEEFVVYSMIMPALKQPKEWGIINPTLFISSSTITNLNSLSNLFRDSLKKVSLRSLKQHLSDFVSECDNVDESSDLVQVSQIMPLMDSDTLHMVISIPDILALAYLVRNSEISDTFNKQINENVNINVTVPFAFTEIELKEYSQYQITATETQKMNVDNDNALIYTFFKFFEDTAVCDIAPNNLEDFLNFHKRKAELENKVIVQLNLQKLIRIFPEKDTMEWCDIIPSLQNELQRQKVVISLDEEKISKISAISDKIDKKINDLKHLFESPKSQYPSLIFESFIDMNLELKNSFESQISTFVSQLDSFYTLFETFTKHIHDKIQPEVIANNVILNLHSWMLIQIPFDSYKAEHPLYSQKDLILMNPPDTAINYYCVEPAPQKVRILFEYENIFKEAISQLNLARTTLIPLVAFNHVNNAVNILNRLFFIEYGSSAQADELTPLIHFLLLQVKIPDFYTFVMYLNDFMSQLTIRNLISLEESETVGLTHIVNHTQSIVSFIEKDYNQNDSK